MKRKSNYCNSNDDGREECELVRVGGGEAAVGVLESLARIAEQREQLQVS